MILINLLSRILEDFLCVMNTHCSKLSDILEPQCGGPEFNIFPLVTHCALDIICETAMGRSINAQEDSDTPYVRAIYQASDIVFQRQRSTFICYLKHHTFKALPTHPRNSMIPSFDSIFLLSCSKLTNPTQHKTFTVFIVFTGF